MRTFLVSFRSQKWLSFILLTVVFLLCNLPSIGQTQTLDGRYAVTRSDNQIFLLNFDPQGTVIVTKKNSEDKDLKEKRSYKIQDGKVSVMPGPGEMKITDFEGVELGIADTEDFSFVKGEYSYKVQKHTPWQGIMHTVSVLLGLLFFYYLCRLSKWFVVASCVILPLFLTIYVWPITTSGTAVDTWFHVAKVWSALAGAVFFTLIRFTKLNNYKWPKFIAAGILVINIVEAVLRDFEMGNGFGGNYHFINGVAGILSIITLSGWLTIEADKSRYKDMIWKDMTLLWIIGYDLWNWSYICNCIPEHAIMGFAVLLSCTIPAMFKVGTWLQARAYTLSAYMMYILTGSKWISHPMNNVLLPDNTTFITILAILSLIVNILNALVHFNAMIKRKAWGFGKPVLTPNEQSVDISRHKLYPGNIKLN